MIKKWEEQFQEFPDQKDKVVTSIRNEIVKNKKFKLPWTFSELSEAIFRVNELIDSFTDK